MNKKLSGTAYFLRDARRIDDLEELRISSIKRNEKGKKYIIEKVIELNKINYENFIEDFLADRDFISDNVDLMYIDDNNIWHCLLVVQKGKSDVGVIVESKKLDFPKYTAIYHDRHNLV